MECIFYLPGRGATAILSLEPDAGSEDVDCARSVLTQRVRPASAIDADRPPFPDRFRDSPEVVAGFAARGADFMAGPTDMKLERQALPSGEAVWVTYDRDRQFTMPFAPTGD